MYEYDVTIDHTTAQRVANSWVMTSRAVDALARTLQ